MSNQRTFMRASANQVCGLLSFLGAASVLLASPICQAGTATYDFSSDPAANPDIQIAGNNPQPWQAAGGNPGGFLAITYAADSQNTTVVFPDIDDGKIVTSFKFDADLRVGNSSDADGRPADGFSISFARGNDPLLADPAASGSFAGGLPEAGTTTGIAIGFDTWSGNTLPDGGDIEGIIVRVDNKTVLRQAMATRNGVCNDTTSLQTGNRDPEYWASGGDAQAPEAWDTLCWQRLSVNLDDQGRLTVTYKGATILNQYQTTYFPSIGRLVLAGRTGGNNEHTHIDNITLTTVAVAADTEKPTVPGNLRVLETGALRAVLAWDASTDNSGRVAYEIEQSGTVLTGATVVSTTNEVRNLSATNAYTFRVRATDVSGNKSDWSAPLNVTTVGLVTDTIFGAAKIYGSTNSPITGTTVAELLADARYPNSPDRIAPVNGLQFGETNNFGETLGDNIGVRIAGTITPPVTGLYHFFIRSDDSSELYLNTNGVAIPVADNASYIATETDCCDAFVEPGTMNDDTSTSPTTATPIPLTAGQKYGILFLVKEGGGGDWGQVAWRREGDTTAAGSLTAITYPWFTPESYGPVDPVGAVVNFTQQPQSLSTPANERVTLSFAAQTASPYYPTPIYQWLLNGTPIPGATGTNYTIPVVAQTNGGTYSVLVAVQGKSVTSSNAVLTVTADTKAPTLLTTAGADTFNNVLLTFSEPVTAPSATTAANYTLSGGGTVTAAQLLNPTTVRLTTSAQTPNTAYTVTLNNVADNAGNPVAAATTGTFTTFSQRPGELRAQFYTGLAGTAVSDLTNSTKFPSLPDDVRFLTSASSPDGYGDNYGVMIRGYLTPTNTANYNFFLRSDDASALYLNTTGEAPPDPFTATPIAVETDCCEAFVEPGTANDDGTTFATTSAPISLTAGQRYGITILMKEGGGGDYVQVAWRAEADTTAADQLQPIGAAFIGTYGPATTGGGLTFTSFTRQGTNLVLAWASGTLESADAIVGPWTPVANASSPATIPIAAGNKFYRLK